MHLKSIVEETIRRHSLLVDGEHVLVALSGGADSVALLRVLLELGYRCSAAHCNFHLRDDESLRDEQFCRDLCQSLSVPLSVFDFDTRAYASARRVSIEMAAREQRYDAFHRLLDGSADAPTAIVVGHHREDCAETLLLNLVRGTGLLGLAGMAPRNGCVVRPMLDASRQDIEDYLAHLRQPFVTDSTNLTDDFARNKVRHQVLPLLQELNPAAIDNLCATASHLRGAHDVLCRAATTEAGQTVLFTLLRPYGYNSAQVEDIFASLLKPSGGQMFVSDSHVLTKDRRRLILDPRQLSHPLTLRLWREGDRFCPFGMKGRSKLVSDVLNDAKLTLPERRRQTVLCHGDDIVWVVGVRSDERYRVPDDATEVLVVEVGEKD